MGQGTSFPGHRQTHPGLHPLPNPHLLCLHSHVGVAPALETLLGPQVLSGHCPGPRSDVHPACLSGAPAHDAHSHSLPRLSPLVLGLYQGTNDTRERKDPTQAHRAIRPQSGTGSPLLPICITFSPGSLPDCPSPYLLPPRSPGLWLQEEERVSSVLRSSNEQFLL